MEAVEAYDKAIAIQGSYVEAWYNKAVSLQNLDKPKGALKAYDRTLELNPDYPDALYNRAGLLLKIGETEKAASDLKRAIELDPSLREKVGDDESLKALLP